MSDDTKPILVPNPFAPDAPAPAPAAAPVAVPVAAAPAAAAPAGNYFEKYDPPKQAGNYFDKYDLPAGVERRGAIGEIANQLKAGVLVDLPKMAGQAIQYTSDPGNKVYEFGKSIADYAREQEKRPDLQPQEAQHGVITNALASGARMIPQSIAPAVGIGLMATGVGAPEGAALLAGSVLGAAPAGMAQAQDTLEKAREKGIGEPEALAAARKTGLIEWTGESAGNFLGGKLFGLAGRAIGKSHAGTAAEQALEGATNTQVVKPWLHQLPETILGEVGTEMGQNAGEAYVEQQAGIDDKKPWDAAKEAIGPTLGMTALLAPFGLAGMGMHAHRQQQRNDILTAPDADPVQRTRIANEIAPQIGDVDKAAERNFRANTARLISANQPITLDKSLFDDPNAPPPPPLAPPGGPGAALNPDDPGAGTEIAPANPMTAAAGLAQPMMPLRQEAAQKRADARSRETGIPHEVVPHPVNPAMFGVRQVPPEAEATTDEADVAPPAAPLVDPATPAAPVGLQPGEPVQVTLNGVDVFPNGTRVTGLTPDGQMATVEGSNAAVPVQNITRIDPAAAAALDAAAHEAATSPTNDRPAPSVAQEDAGNYKKGAATVQGLSLMVENPVGTTRTGTDSDGTPWSTTMSDHYGYIRGTVGADGKPIDAYIGPNPASHHAFIVDQMNQDTGEFDEHKVMLGYNSQEQAQQAYEAHYTPSWQGSEKISATTVDGLKAWLRDGDTKQAFNPAHFPDSEAPAAPAAPAQTAATAEQPAQPDRRQEFREADADIQETLNGLAVDRVDLATLDEALAKGVDPRTGKPISSEGFRVQYETERDRLRESVATATEFLQRHGALPKEDTQTAPAQPQQVSLPERWDAATPDARANMLRAAGRGDVAEDLMHSAWGDLPPLPQKALAAPPDSVPPHERPLADKGLTSYRYQGPMGWVMIGAKDHEDALRQANRSLEKPGTPDQLQVWDGERYVDVNQAPAKPHDAVRIAQREQDKAEFAWDALEQVSQSLGNDAEIQKLQPLADQYKGAAAEHGRAKDDALKRLDEASRRTIAREYKERGDQDTTELAKTLGPLRVEIEQALGRPLKPSELPSHLREQPAGPTTSAEPGDQSDLHQRVLKALQPDQFGGRLTPERLGGILGDEGKPGSSIGTARARQALDELVEKGDVVKDGHSYHLRDGGPVPHAKAEKPAADAAEAAREERVAKALPEALDALRDLRKLSDETKANEAEAQDQGTPIPEEIHARFRAGSAKGVEGPLEARLVRALMAWGYDASNMPMNMFGRPSDTLPHGEVALQAGSKAKIRLQVHVVQAPNGKWGVGISNHIPGWGSTHGVSTLSPQFDSRYDAVAYGMQRWREELADTKKAHPELAGYIDMAFGRMEKEFAGMRDGGPVPKADAKADATPAHEQTREQHRNAPDRGTYKGVPAAQIKLDKQTALSLMKDHKDQVAMLGRLLNAKGGKDLKKVAADIVRVHGLQKELAAETEASLMTRKAPDLKALAKRVGVYAGGAKADMAQAIIKWRDGLQQKFDDKVQDIKHRAAVLKAIRDGKTVPDAVLADYPNIAAFAYERGTPQYQAAVDNLARGYVNPPFMSVPGRIESLRQDAAETLEPDERHLLGDIADSAERLLAKLRSLNDDTIVREDTEERAWQSTPFAERIRSLLAQMRAVGEHGLAKAYEGGFHSEAKAGRLGEERVAFGEAKARELAASHAPKAAAKDTIGSDPVERTRAFLFRMLGADSFARLKAVHFAGDRRVLLSELQGKVVGKNAATLAKLREAIVAAAELTGKTEAQQDSAIGRWIAGVNRVDDSGELMLKPGQGSYEKIGEFQFDTPHGAVRVDVRAPWSHHANESTFNLELHGESISPSGYHSSMMVPYEGKPTEANLRRAALAEVEWEQAAQRIAIADDPKKFAEDKATHERMLAKGRQSNEERKEAAAPAPIEKPAGKVSPRDRVREADPFLALLAGHGVALSLQADLGLEKGNRGNRMVPGFGPVMRNNGLNLDELAEAARDAGFITQQDIDDPHDNGATRKISDLIHRAVAKREVIPALGQVEDDAQRRAETRAEGELQAQAEAMGIPTAGRSIDEIHDAVRERLAENLDVPVEVYDDIQKDADALQDDITADMIDRGLDAAFAQEPQPQALNDDQLDEIFGLPAQHARVRPAQDDDAGTAPAGAETAESPANPENTEPAAEVAGFALSGQSLDEGRAAAVAEEARKEAEAKAEREAERRAQADKERDSFSLTGSDRPADVLAAQGQTSIFDLPAEPAAPAKQEQDPEQAVLAAQERKLLARELLTLDDLTPAQQEKAVDAARRRLVSEQLDLESRINYETRRKLTPPWLAKQQARLVEVEAQLAGTVTPTDGEILTAAGKPRRMKWEDLPYMAGRTITGVDQEKRFVHVYQQLLDANLDPATRTRLEQEKTAFEEATSVTDKATWIARLQQLAQQRALDQAAPPARRDRSPEAIARLKNPDTWTGGLPDGLARDLTVFNNVLGLSNGTLPAKLTLDALKGYAKAVQEQGGVAAWHFYDMVQRRITAFDKKDAKKFKEEVAKRLAQADAPALPTRTPDQEAAAAPVKPLALPEKLPSSTLVAKAIEHVGGDATFRRLAQAHLADLAESGYVVTPDELGHELDLLADDLLWAPHGETPAKFQEISDEDYPPLPGREYAQIDDPGLERLVGLFPPPGPLVNAAKQAAGERLTVEQAAARLATWKEEAKHIGATGKNARKVILSLFDSSGVWSQPYVDAGYVVLRYDLNHGDNLVEKFPMNDIVTLRAAGYEIAGVIAQPPCTSFSNAGRWSWPSQHESPSKYFIEKKYGAWATKYFDTAIDAADTLGMVAQAVIEFAAPTEFYVMENPRGRIAERLQLPNARMVIQPHVYGNAYTKETFLYGEFNTDLPSANVSPKEEDGGEGSRIYKLRGTDAEEHAARSLTPEGFAYAWFMANHDRAAIAPRTGLAKHYTAAADERRFNTLLDKMEQGDDKPMGWYGDVGQPLRFESGMSAAKDFEGVFANDKNVGISLNDLAESNIERLAKAMALTRNAHLFVDSGAFSLFGANMKAQASGQAAFTEFGEGGRALSFDKILDLYHALGSAISKADSSGYTADRVFYVMPDVVGNQAVSLALVGKYRDIISGTGFQRAIVPLQGGALSLTQAYEAMMTNLGLDPKNDISPIIGLPSKAEAVSNDEITALLNAYGDNIGGLHVLGAATEKALTPRLDAIRAAGYDGNVSADAFTLRGKLSAGTPRAEAFRKIAGDLTLADIAPGKQPIDEMRFGWIADLPGYIGSLEAAREQLAADPASTRVPKGMTFERGTDQSSRNNYYLRAGSVLVGMQPVAWGEGLNRKDMLKQADDEIRRARGYLAANPDRALPGVVPPALARLTMPAPAPKPASRPAEPPKLRGRDGKLTTDLKAVLQGHIDDGMTGLREEDGGVVLSYPGDALMGMRVTDPDMVAFVRQAVAAKVAEQAADARYPGWNALGERVDLLLPRRAGGLHPSQADYQKVADALQLPLADVRAAHDVHRFEGAAVPAHDAPALPGDGQAGALFSRRDDQYERSALPREQSRVFKRAVDNLLPAEQAALDAFVRSHPDGASLVERLQAHAGTPWAKQALEGVFIRQAILTYAAGGTPAFHSIMEDPSVHNLRRLLSTLGTEGIMRHVEANGLIGSAAKPINNVSSSFINCNPSEDCAKYCYATGNKYPTTNPMIKSELVTLAVELFAQRAAQRTADEYKMLPEFAAHKALRLFDKGDGNAAWLPYIQALNAAGVRVQIFSKNPEFLRRVPTVNVRMLSIDQSNLHLADLHPDLSVAFVYDKSPGQIAFIAKLVQRGQLSVVLPIKQGQRVMSKDEVKELAHGAPGVGPYICPVDAGFKPIGDRHSGNDKWNCTKCDKNGLLGCFFGSPNKLALGQALQPKGNVLATLALQLQERINAAIRGETQDAAGIGSAVAAPGHVPEAGVSDLLRQFDGVVGQLFALYDPGAAGDVSVGGRDGTETAGRGNDGAAERAGPGGRTIPIAKARDEDGNPLASHGAVAPSRLPVAALQAALGTLTSAWKNAPRGGIHGVATVADLPADLLGRIPTADLRTLRGLYDPLTQAAYVVADRVQNLREAQFVLGHEVLGHAGLRAILDQGQLDRELARLRDMNPALAAAAQDQATRYKLDLNTATEEALADWQGEGRTINGWQRFAAKIQAALRAIGLHAVADWMEGRTQAETLALLARARDAITGQDSLRLFGASDALRYSSDRAPRWESVLAERISRLPTKTAPAAQWLNVLTGLQAKGVKQDEIEWSGIKEWLQLQGNKVTKDQVLSFLADHGVKVEEVIKGQPDPAYDARMKAYQAGREEYVLDQIEEARAEHAKKQEEQVQDRLDSVYGGHYVQSGTYDDGETVWELWSEWGNEPIQTFETEQEAEDAAMEANDAERAQAETDLRNELDEFDEDEARFFAERDFDYDHEEPQQSEDTSFDKYRTVPGGDQDSYREMLITLADIPGGQVQKRKAVFDKYERQIRAVMAERMAALKADDYPLANELQNRYNAILSERDLEARAAAGETDGFNNDHWKQGNVLAHVRFDVRTNPQGESVLQVHEIQSDWAEQGRSQGFADDAARELLEVRREIAAVGGADGVVKKLEEQEAAFEARTGTPAFDFASGRANPAFENVPEADEWNRLAGLAEREQLLANARAVPQPAPFVKKTEAWVGLALKRIMTYAAENGIAHVALPTGDQANAIFSLENRVEIEYQHKPDGRVWMHVTRADNGMTVTERTVGQKELPGIVGKEVANKILRKEGDEKVDPELQKIRERGEPTGVFHGPDGQHDESLWYIRFQHGQPDGPYNQMRTAKAVGRAIRDKLREDPARKLAGEDLKIGGEPMRKFYDGMVVNIANDLLRRFGGGRVETMRVAGKGDFIKPVIEESNGKFVVKNALTGKYFSGEVEDPTWTDRPDPEMQATLRTTAEHWAADLMLFAPLAQPGFTMTPALVERATRGLPLFSQRAQPQRAGWSADRIDRLLSTYAYTNHDGKTKAYAAWITPQEYLALTTGDAARIASNARPLDVGELARQSQEPYLQVDDLPHGGTRVTGHEGRHRAYAMLQAGVERFPVVVYSERGAVLKARPLLRLDGQDFGHQRAPGRAVALRYATPITYDNRALLLERFGQADAGMPLFSHQDADGSTRERAAPGANVQRLASLLGPQLYGDMTDMGPVTVKELFQNAFDALKGSLESGQLTHGRIAITTDRDSRTITVADNGAGMTPAIINKAFLTIAGTSKETTRSSGGFGIAKMLFLFGNKNLTLVTVRDGVEARLETSGEQLMAAFNDPAAAPEIVTRPTTAPSGTTITVTLPHSVTNPSTGAEDLINFPSGRASLDRTLEHSPLFENIAVSFNGETIPIGSKFPKDDYTTFATVKFDWGTARIIVAKKENPSAWGANLHMLSNGLWQFSQSLKENPFDYGSANVPRQFYINIEPRVKPEEAGYPFALNRKGLAPAVRDDFAKIEKYLSVLYGANKAAEVAAGFGAVQYVNDDGSVSAPQQLAPKVDDSTRQNMLVINEGDQIEVHDGRMLVNGRAVPELTADQMSKVKTDISKFKVDQRDVDPSRPMIHDNVDLQWDADAEAALAQAEQAVERAKRAREAAETAYEAASEAYYATAASDPGHDALPERLVQAKLEVEQAWEAMHATRNAVTAARDAYHNALVDVAPVPVTQVMRAQFGARFDRFVGDLGRQFMRLRDAAAAADEDAYGKLATVPVGVSFDQDYYGVHTTLPFRGMFLNPALTPVDDADASGPRASSKLIASSMVGTMLHEIAHFREMNHSTNFISEMQRVTALLDSADNFNLAGLKQEIRSILDRNHDIYAALNRAFRGEHVVNRGVKLEDGSAYAARDERTADDVGQAGRARPDGRRLVAPAGDRAVAAAGGRQRGRAGDAAAAARDVAPRLAPNGRPSNLTARQWAQVRTPAFKAWFGDWEHDPARASKVIDENGEPRAVIHGTHADFTSFDKGKIRQPGGFWFAERRDYVDNISHADREGFNQMPVFLNIRRPLDSGRYAMARKGENPFDNGAVQRNLKMMGGDGVRLDNGHDSTWIALEPGQVKSAIGNDGQFDRTSTDIRFSRRDGNGPLPVATDPTSVRLSQASPRQMARSVGSTLKGATVTRLGNSLAHYRSVGLQFLGRLQLTDLYGKQLFPQGNLPNMMQSYSDLADLMDAEKNEGGSLAGAIVDRWARLKDGQAFAKLAHDSTRLGIDPRKAYQTGDSYTDYKDLRDRFENGLSPEARALFDEAANAYASHYAKVQQAVRERINRNLTAHPGRAALLAQLEGEFFSRKVKGIYFPFARFGDYVIQVQFVGRNPVPGQSVVREAIERAETLNEAEDVRARLLKEYPPEKGFKVLPVIKAAEYNAARDSVGREFVKKLFGVLDDAGLQDPSLQDTLNQLILASMPDLSFAKSAIHRTGVPGFSEDARRAFAHHMFHGASYLAKLNYSDRLAAVLDGMQRWATAHETDPAYDQVKAQQVIDEMNKRHDSYMNPKGNPLATKLTSLGFVFYLGASPASALSNLLQTPTVAFPLLGGRFGFAKAAAALLRASQDATRGHNDMRAVLKDPLEKRAYDEWLRMGKIDLTMSHDLAGVASGRDNQLYGKMRQAMKVASFMFHHAERFNRQTTLLAAFRLARDKGMDYDDAFRASIELNDASHFNYAQSNRPRFMQGPVAQVIWLFKQYAQNLIYTFARNAQKSFGGDREAMRTLSGLLVTHALAAGVIGLPAVSMLLGAASMVGGGDDEPWDAEVALRRLLADLFGETAGQVIAHGVTRPTPFDISRRVGAENLIFPDVQEGLQGAEKFDAYVAGLLGPVVGMGVNWAKALAQWSRGDTSRAVETALPSVLKGPTRGLRYFNEEGAKDRNGLMVADDVSALEYLGQGLGFSSGRINDAQEAKSAMFQRDQALQHRRRALLDSYARHMMKQEDVSADLAAIQAFNQAHPSRVIAGMAMQHAIRTRMQHVNQAKGGLYLSPKRALDARQAGDFDDGID